MKTNTIAMLITALFITMVLGCNKADEEKKGAALLLFMSSGDLLANMSQSSLDSVNDSLADINDSGVTNVSYQVNFPGILQQNPNWQERICTVESRILETMSARAAAVSCPGGGSVDVTDPAGTWNSGNSSFYIIRAFNDCTGPYGHFKVGGDVILSWTGMDAGATGAAKLQAGSKLEQAPVNKRFTRVATGGYITVTGNGSSLTSGSLTGNIAHTVNWSSVSGTSRTCTVDTNLTRAGYTASGSKFFEHQVTTPAPLTVTADLTGSTRSVTGTVSIEHVLSGVTVTTSFSGLVIPMDTCIPASGSAAITISGARNGSGTITYNGDGTADYDYTYTNARGTTFNGNGAFVVSGCQ